jgi:hypothetical protein
MAAGSASADWIDWTSTTSGTMNVDGETVGVTLTGNSFSHHNGSFYYTHSSANANNTFAGLNPSDLLHVNEASDFTLTFDKELDGLTMALVSVGSYHNPVTYDFENAFNVLSSGPNHWGYTGYSVSGNSFTGQEYNGVLTFEGTFNSISFSTLQDEYWHGFNFSSDSLATGVSEPASFAILGLGLVGLGAIRRKQRVS